MDEGYNYFALGNSITKHGKNNYWWNEIGMAATDASKDYVHLVVDYLSKNESTKFYAYNFSIWEMMAYDRSEAFSCIETYMSDKLDLITIQLGENVNNIDTYRNDYIDLINYVKEKSPNAQIIMIDDFWDNGEKVKIKREVANEFLIKWVDLSDIKGNKKYQSAVGKEVYDDEGNVHSINHSGVASHPGNEGMRLIADRVIGKIVKY